MKKWYLLLTNNYQKMYLPGDTILLSDGEIELKVIKKDIDNIYCQVIIGGVLTPHKGINIPTRSLSISPITEKDKKDLEFGIEQDVDYIALSFVKSAEDIIELRKLIQLKGKGYPNYCKDRKTRGSRQPRKYCKNRRCHNGGKGRFRRGNTVGTNSIRPEEDNFPCESIFPSGHYRHTDAAFYGR